MKFEVKQFEKAQELFRNIDNNCDCRIWNKDGQNEITYRKLKHAVRAWSYAITFGYMDKDGTVLVSETDIALAREYAEKGSSKYWGGDLHKKYLDDKNLIYRRAINAGSKILEIEGILSLGDAIQIYEQYKGKSLPLEKNNRMDYTEMVLSGRYVE